MSRVSSAAFFAPAAAASQLLLRAWFGPRFHQTVKGPSTSTRPSRKAKPVAGERRGVPGTHTNGGCYTIDMCCCCCCCGGGVVIHSPALHWEDTCLSVGSIHSEQNDTIKPVTQKNTHRGVGGRAASCYTKQISNKTDRQEVEIKVKNYTLKAPGVQLVLDI